MIPTSYLNAAHQPVDTKSAPVAGFGSRIGPVYNADRPRARIAKWGVVGNVWTGVFIGGLGEVADITDIRINDEAVPPEVEVSKILGSTSQGVNALAAAGITTPVYNDTFVYERNGDQIAAHGLVVKLPVGSVQGFPRVTFTSEPLEYLTPAEVLADLLSNLFYGRGKTVNAASVEAVKALNNEQIGGENRHEFIDSIDGRGKKLSISQWIQILEKRAHCFVVEEENEYRLIPDAPAESEMEINGRDHIVKGTFKKDRSELPPTVVHLTYTDSRVIPWREATVSVYAEGVKDGTREARETTLKREDIHRPTQAVREALEALWTPPWSYEFQTFDEGMLLHRGMVVTLNYQAESNGKLVDYVKDAKVRITRVLRVATNKYAVTAETYDESQYSQDTSGVHIEQPPTLPAPEIGLPPRFLNEDFNGIQSDEQYCVKASDGTVVSRMYIPLAPDPEDMHFSRFICEYRKVGDVQWTGAAVSDDHAYTGSVIDGEEYEIRAWTENSFSYMSEITDATHTVVGKTSPPPNVSNFDAEGMADGRVNFTGDYDRPADHLGFWISINASGSYQRISEVPIPELPYLAPNLPSGNYSAKISAVDTGYRESNESTTSVNLSASVTEVFNGLVPAPLLSQPAGLIGNTFNGPTARIEWTPEPDALEYRVEVWVSGQLKKTHKTGASYFDYSASQARSDGMTPSDTWRTIQFRVRSFDRNGGLSSNYSAVSLTNSAPGALSNFNATVDGNYVLCSYNLPNDNDLAGVLIEVDGKIASDTKNADGVRVPLPNGSASHTIKGAAYDTWGKSGLSWSTRNVTEQKVDLGDTEGDLPLDRTTGGVDLDRLPDLSNDFRQERTGLNINVGGTYGPTHGGYTMGSYFLQSESGRGIFTYQVSDDFEWYQDGPGEIYSSATYVPSLQLFIILDSITGPVLLKTVYDVGVTSVSCVVSGLEAGRTVYVKANGKVQSRDGQYSSGQTVQIKGDTATFMGMER